MKVIGIDPETTDKFIHLKDDVYYSLFLYKTSERRRYWIKTTCSSCSKQLFVDRNNFKKHNKCYCSKECKKISCSGSNNVNWSGGRKNKRGTKGGHILIYMPDHPKAKKNFVPEHRVIVEKEINRVLLDDEFVHHIDCNMQNNDINNLDIVNRTQHTMAHNSLNNCVEALIQMGVLRYNKITKIYEVVT